MTANPELVQVGWYCWRCEGLVEAPCRSDSVPVYVEAEWSEEMDREIRRLGEEDDEPAVPAGQAPATGQAGLREQTALKRAHVALAEQAGRDQAALARVHEWVTSDVVTARNEFGNGYREAQRDIRDLLDGRRLAAAPPEPPVHGESVAALAGLPGRRDQWDGDQPTVVFAVQGQADGETGAVVCICGHSVLLHHEDVCLIATCSCADVLELGALPEVLEAVLTKRFTELGNPFSEMRRREQGPDGWPASHPVGPRGVAEVLRELLARDVQPAAGAQQPKEA